MNGSEVEQFLSVASRALVEGIGNAKALAHLYEAARAAQLAVERASRGTQLLLALASALARALTVEDVVAIVLGEAFPAFDADGGCVALIASDRASVELVGAKGLPPTLERRLSLDDESPGAFAARTGEPLWFESREAYAERYAELASISSELGVTRALAAVPLKANGKVIGAIVFSFAAPRIFDEHERGIVTLFAEQCAQAMQRAQLHDLMGRQTEALRLSQEALRRSERQFAAIVESSPDVVFRFGRDLRHTYVSSNVERATGIPAERFLGKTAREGGLAAESCAIADEKCHEAFETGREAVYEMSYPDPNGEGRYYRTRLVPERGEGGAIDSIVGTTEDITERKRAEIERAHLLERERAARAFAEEANRAKDQFLATVSHELRAPLAAINMWTQVLLAGRADEATRARALTAIHLSSSSQSKLIDDLLDLARSIGGKLRVDLRPLDFAKVVSAAVDALRPQMEEKNLVLTTELEEPARMHGDKERLGQIVRNVLANAVKFTPRRGRVDVRLERRDALLRLTVRDTGIGIGADFLPHVFDHFRQADGSHTRAHGGLGLGLAIARELVQLHAGTIRAESRGEGQGATFIVDLPASVASSVVETPTTSPVESSAALVGVRVLVVDDERDVRDGIAAVLCECGAVVATAGSVSEALASFHERVPHVVLSDISMPGEDGYALIRKVRALTPAQGGDVPAMALTAHAGAGTRNRVLAAGFQEHVSK